MPRSGEVKPTHFPSKIERYIATTTTPSPWLAMSISVFKDADLEMHSTPVLSLDFEARKALAKVGKGGIKVLAKERPYGGPARKTMPSVSSPRKLS